MRGFLKWLQREQPNVYKQLAPKIAATQPGVFSDYTQSRTQLMRGRAGMASLAARTRSLSGLGRLGQSDGSASDLSSQIQVVASSDLTPVNVAVDDTYTSQLPTTNVDVTDAANTTAGTPTASTNWISQAVSGITSLWTTQAQLSTAQSITNLQLQRAQQGLSPLNIGMNANGIPTIGGMLAGGGSLLLIGGAVLLFLMMGRSKAA
jgi:hypothetical protein